MGILDGRVVIITGAGRGLGREHALLCAAEGARLVVNDRGGAADGSGSSETEAEELAKEIRAAGGDAVANHEDVADFDGAGRLVEQAMDTYGDLHALVNNAGILRDRFLINMTPDEFDEVVRVHLRGHFAPTRWAAALWRRLDKDGRKEKRNIVSTSSTSGLFSNPGQTNYAAAKSGIQSMALVWAKELERYGVVSNSVAPIARTRLTEGTPGVADWMAPPTDRSFDWFSPANVSPLVAYLASEACEFTGHCFLAQGDQVVLLKGWGVNKVVENRCQRWATAELATALSEWTGEEPLGTRYVLRSAKNVAGRD